MRDEKTGEAINLMDLEHDAAFAAHPALRQPQSSARKPEPQSKNKIVPATGDSDPSLLQRRQVA